MLPKDSIDCLTLPFYYYEWTNRDPMNGRCDEEDRDERKEGEGG